MPSWLDRSQRTVLALTAFLYSAGYATVGLFAMLLTVVPEGIVRRRLPWRRTHIDLLIVLFIGLFLISGYLSDFKPIAVGSSGLAALTIYLTLGVLSRVLRRHPAFLSQFLWLWLIGGTLAGAWAIALHVRTRTPAFTPELGQNAVGTTMLIATVIGLGLFLSVSSRWRYAALGMSAVTAAALAFSNTRGAWLGAVAGVALLIGFGGRRVVGQTLVAIAALAVVGALIVGPEGGAALIRRARTIPSTSANVSRLYMFQAARAIAMDHPVFGTGMNTFPMVYLKYRLPGDPNPVPLPYAHNIFLNMAAEGGLLGLAIFFALLVQTFRLGWKWRACSSSDSESALRTALLAALAGMLIHQLFDGTLISVHLGAGMWMVTAIVISGSQWPAGRAAPE